MPRPDRVGRVSPTSSLPTHRQPSARSVGFRTLAAALLVAAAALGSPGGAIATDGGVEGIASHYGPGTGVATPWCTWVRRHSVGCGFLVIQSHDTGLTATAPVIDWCQCYRHRADARIVDLQWGVVSALGLERSAGLYAVTVWRLDTVTTPALPDTAIPRRSHR